MKRKNNNQDIDKPSWRKSYVSFTTDVRLNNDDWEDYGDNKSEIVMKADEDLGRQVTTKQVFEGDMLDKCPPDFNLARIHENAQKVKNLDQANYKHSKLDDIKYFWPWCQMPTTESAPLYPMCCNIMELEDLGWGFPLYFYFKKFLGVIYIIMIILISIIGWSLYARPRDGGEWVDEDEDPPFIISLSIGNLGKNSDNYKSTEIYVMIALTTLTIIIIFVMHILFKPIQTKVIKKVDEINITPSDFTIMISNIPLDKTKDDIKEWLLTHQDGEICDINLCFDIKEPIYKLRKVNKLK